jgi:hypothetical protein
MSGLRRRGVRWADSAQGRCAGSATIRAGRVPGRWCITSVRSGRGSRRRGSLSRLARSCRRTRRHRRRAASVKGAIDEGNRCRARGRLGDGGRLPAQRRPPALRPPQGRSPRVGPAPPAARACGRCRRAAGTRSSSWCAPGGARRAPHPGSPTGGRGPPEVGREQPRWPGGQAVARALGGGWTRALAAAGVEPARERTIWTDKQIVAALKDWADAHGDAPTQRTEPARGDRQAPYLLAGPKGRPRVRSRPPGCDRGSGPSSSSTALARQRRLTVEARGGAPGRAERRPAKRQRNRAAGADRQPETLGSVDRGGPTPTTQPHSQNARYAGQPAPSAPVSKVRSAPLPQHARRSPDGHSVWPAIWARASARRWWRCPACKMCAAPRMGRLASIGVALARSHLRAAAADSAPRPMG